MAFMVYFFENKVHEARNRISEINEKLARYDEDLKVLEAEWSYLNNPARLSELAKKIDDGMESPSRLQFTNLKDLPTREVLTAKAESEQLVP